MTVKQLTRIGVSYIEEAILEILFQSHGTYLRAAAISRDCGLSTWDTSQWTASQILRKLEEDGRVEARLSENGRQRTGWKLTTREFDRRADISS